MPNAWPIFPRVLQQSLAVTSSPHLLGSWDFPVRIIPIFLITNLVTPCIIANWSLRFPDTNTQARRLLPKHHDGHLQSMNAALQSSSPWNQRWLSNQHWPHIWTSQQLYQGSDALNNSQKICEEPAVLVRWCHWKNKNVKRCLMLLVDRIDRPSPSQIPSLLSSDSFAAPLSVEVLRKTH